MSQAEACHVCSQFVAYCCTPEEDVMTSRIILAAALLALPALEGSDAQLTPREMFYHRDDAPPPPPTATPGHTATTKHRTRTAKPQDTAKAKAAPISQDAPPA